MQEAHTLNGLCNTVGFITRRNFWLLSIDQTKTTCTSAAFSEHHERCCAVRPTFRQVRAPCFFTHGDKAKITHHFFRFHHFFSEANFRAQPIGFAFFNFETVTHACLSQTRDEPHRFACTFTTRECRKIFWTVIPRNVLTGSLPIGESKSYMTRHHFRYFL